MIRVVDLWKVFKLYRSPADRLKEILFRRTYHRNFEALKGVSFEVADGEVLGIIGPNGAGKSTLLKILTGVLLPDRGEIAVSGRITGLLELGTGFNAEMTGLENIFLNGTLLGMTREEIEEKIEEIMAFSELGEFVYEPLKTYSSGMIMRLAFAIAIHADPSCFVVDEALAVGDAYFQQKCLHRIKAFKEAGGTIVFVSHDLNAVKLLCDRALLLDQGTVVEEGEPEKVINLYNFLLAKRSRGEEVEISHYSAERCDYGDYTARIEAVRLLDPRGEQRTHLVSGEPIILEVEISAQQPLADLTLGFLFRDRFGQDIFGTNTFHLGVPLGLRAHERKRIQFLFDHFDLGPGLYTLTVALHQGETHLQRCFHWVDRALKFEVLPSSPRFIGLVRLRPQVRLLEDVGEAASAAFKEETSEKERKDRGQEAESQVNPASGKS